MRKNLLTWLSAMLLIAILLTACGGAATPSASRSQAPASNRAPAPTDVPPTAEPEMTEEP